MDMRIMAQKVIRISKNNYQKLILIQKLIKKRDSYDIGINNIVMKLFAEGDPDSIFLDFDESTYENKYKKSWDRKRKIYGKNGRNKPNEEKLPKYKPKDVIIKIAEETYWMIEKYKIIVEKQLNSDLKKNEKRRTCYRTFILNQMFEHGIPERVFKFKSLQNQH